MSSSRPESRSGPPASTATVDRTREETAGTRTAAVVDLGSNSWRLVVYDFVSGGHWRRTGALSEPVRIAAGLAATGRLSERAIERGLDTLRTFARYCESRGLAACDVEAVATSAVRDATNGLEFVARAHAVTGWEIDVLSAEAEAYYGYLAAVNSTTLRDGAVLDLGGGSLQLVAVRDREVQASGTWPLGAVRVTERLLPGRRPVSRKELKRARAALRADLAAVSGLEASRTRLVGLGGAVRNLAAAAGAAKLGPAGIQGYVMGAADLRALVTGLARRPASRRALPGIKPARADVILGAALVLEGVVDLGGFKGIEVTRAGLREGIFIDTRLRVDRAPLVPDVRAAAVRGLAERCRADVHRAEHVTRLALARHGAALAAARLEPGPGEREILSAAAMLHEAGVAIDYEGRDDHASYVIRHAGLDGFAPRELAQIAEIARCQRKGRPDVAGADREQAQRCVLALRAALQSAG